MRANLNNTSVCFSSVNPSRHNHIDDHEVPGIINKGFDSFLTAINRTNIVSQLIQGTFPNYSQLIPESYGTRVTVELEDFLRATRTASIFARDGSGIVRLQVSAGDNGTTGQLMISSRAEELGDNQGEISAKVEGDDAKIAFNAKYLAEVLDVLGKGEVALETTSPSSPGVLRPVNTDEYIHVVMPMFVQW